MKIKSTIIVTIFMTLILSSSLVFGTTKDDVSIAFDAGTAPITAPAVTSTVVAPSTTAPTAAPPVVVEAGPLVKKNTALMKLSDELMGILVPVVLALFSALLAWILNWVRKKFHLNVSDAQLDSWAKIADMAGDRAGEWARNKAKDLAEGKKVPGGDTMNIAVDWAIEMGRSLKLPQIGREKLIGLIESKLHVKRQSA